MSNDSAALFISTMLHSATVTHLQHLATKSYAQHVALGEYYDAIPGLVDKYAEAYQGKYGIIKNYPKDTPRTDDPKVYVKALLRFLEDIKKVLPKDTDLVNLFDTVTESVTSLKYKLENLS